MFLTVVIFRKLGNVGISVVTFWKTENTIFVNLWTDLLAFFYNIYIIFVFRFCYFFFGFAINRKLKIVHKYVTGSYNYSVNGWERWRWWFPFRIHTLTRNCVRKLYCIDFATFCCGKNKTVETKKKIKLTLTFNFWPLNKKKEEKKPHSAAAKSTLAFSQSIFNDFILQKQKKNIYIYHGRRTYFEW